MRPGPLVSHRPRPLSLEPTSIPAPGILRRGSGGLLCNSPEKAIGQWWSVCREGGHNGRTNYRAATNIPWVPALPGFGMISDSSGSFVGCKAIQ
jgi:hypothetical protein